MRWVLVAAVASVAAFGCSLCTEVETLYRGTRSGTLVVVEEGSAGQGLSLTPKTGPWDDRDAFSGGTVCTSARAAALPGQVLIAWLSPDDLATVSQRCTPADAGPFDPRPAACAPGTSDPQARKDYELPASGSVVTQIELLDP